MLRPQFADLVHSLASQPLGVLLLLGVQLCILALIASGLSRIIARSDPSRTHGIWLTAILLGLVFVPLHLFRVGWPIPVAVSGQSNVSRISSLPAVDQVLAVDQMPAVDQVPVTAPISTHLGEPATAGEARDSIVSTERPEPSLDALSHANLPANEMPTVDNIEPEDATKPETNHDLSFVVGSKPSGSVLTRVLIGAYVLGLVFFASRLLYSMILLRSLVRRSVLPNEQTLQDTARIAALIGSSPVPTVRQSQHVAIPMVVGFWRPVVMLPVDFDSWARSERDLTLLHELTHVLRKDALFRYLSAINRVIYWFHPVSRLLDRRLSESREWATDQEVIHQSRKVGLNANHYADCLLSVVTRASQIASHDDSVSGPVVAMSASDDLEQRLRLIVKTRPDLLRISNRGARVAIALLVACTILSAVRLQVADAQTLANNANTTDIDPSEAKSSGKEQSESKEKTANAKAEADTELTLASVDPGDENLWYKIRDATAIESADRETAIAILDVSGIVVTDTGQPVVGATVLLRESSTIRISQDLKPVDSDEKVYLRQVDDVLAKTKSDEDGRFEFREIVAPGFKRPTTSTWRGDVVAAHDELGIGYLSLGGKKEKRQRESGVSIKLGQTSSIKGRLVSADLTPISDAIVSLGQLIKPSNDRFAQSQKMDLQSSQITPRTRTDSDGRFRFTHVPESFVASVWIYDPDSAGASVGIRTSDDVAIEGPFNSSYLRNTNILSSPATIVVDPGVMVSGNVVDEDGRPVSDAKVRFGGLVRHFVTDEEGRVRIRVATTMLESYKKHPQPDGAASIPVSVRAGNGHDYLPGNVRVLIDDIESGKGFQETLAKGIRVSGTVVDEDGVPLDGIGVSITTEAPSIPGESDDQGKFELMLPKGKHILVFFSDRNDVKLPDRRETFRLKDKLDQLLTRTIDLSDRDPKELEPVVIAKAETLQVIVSLPDGSPAVDANVIVRDEEMQDVGFSEGARPMVVEKSTAVLTNSIGRAELSPKGVLSDAAWVDLSLVQSDSAYNATVKVSTAVNGVLAVVLSEAPVLEGRVLVDGQGIAGAKVSVGESREVRRKTPVGMITSFTTSNHQSVVTDQEGYYRLPISRNKRYSISIQSIPGENARPGMGYSASSSGPGIVQVKDFEFYHGTEEISGRVVDAAGNPVAEASVSIRRDTRTSPSFWIGHYEDSQRKTDAEGRFRLSSVPLGSYRIMVSGKRSPDRERRPLSTMTTANSGESDLIIRLVGASSTKPIPRLKPIRIEPNIPTQ